MPKIHFGTYLLKNNASRDYGEYVFLFKAFSFLFIQVKQQCSEKTRK